MLRKRMSVAEPSGSPTLGSSTGGNTDAARALDRLPPPDFAGYLRKKGERYNSWKLRYCVLSGPHLYYLKSENVSPSRKRRRRSGNETRYVLTLTSFALRCFS